MSGGSAVFRSTKFVTASSSRELSYPQSKLSSQTLLLRASGARCTAIDGASGAQGATLTSIQVQKFADFMYPLDILRSNPQLGRVARKKRKFFKRGFAGTEDLHDVMKQAEHGPIKEQFEVFRRSRFQIFE